MNTATRCRVALNDYPEDAAHSAQASAPSGAEMPDLSRHRAAACAGSLAALGGVRDHARGFHARLFRRPGIFQWQPGSLSARKAGSGNPPLGPEQMAAHAGADPLPARQPLHAARSSSSGCGVAPTSRRPPARVATRFCQRRTRALLDALRARAARALGLPPDRVILVFDADRKAIYAGKPGPKRQECQRAATRANDRLQELAAQSGLRVIDSYPVFKQYFDERLGPLDRSPRGCPLERLPRIGSWPGKWHASSNARFGHASQLYFPILC